MESRTPLRDSLCGSAGGWTIILNVSETSAELPEKKALKKISGTVIEELLQRYHLI
ncbi:MAG: hypothetical protein UDG86_16595 [Lachnospiraceae bacterium]|jgi:hypothetical protein|nr:hypothetical protein [Lachnospiraceae bacterium]